MKFRKLIMAMAAALSSASLLAAPPLDAKMMVTLNDGSQNVYQFDESVKIKYVDREMLLTTATVDVVIPLDNLNKIEYVNVSGISALPDGATQIRISQTEGEIIVSGAEPAIAITANTISGITMARTSADTDGEVRIDISAWTPGVYLLNVGTQSFKLVIR